MRWKLFANLAETAGTREVPLELSEGATFRDAFDTLLENHPGLRDDVLDDDGDLHDHIRVLHNAKNPFVARQGWQTPVEDGDELALFPPVSGG